MSEGARQHEVLPYISTWDHDDIGSVVLMADGSYGVAWELSPFDLLTFDDQNTLDLESHLYRLLSSLPYGSFRLEKDDDFKQSGAYYQLINFRNDDFGSDITRMENAIIGASGIAAEAAKEYVDHMNNLTKRHAFVRRRPILFVRYYPEQNNAKKASGWMNFLSYTIKPSAIAELISGRRIQQLYNDVSNIENIMREGSLSPKRLSSSELRKVLYNFLNPSSLLAGVPLDIKYTLRSQVMPDFTPGNFMFELDGMWHAVLSLRTLPSVISSCSANFFKMADGDVIMNFAVYPSHLTEKVFEEKARLMKFGFTEPDVKLGKKDLAEASRMLKSGATFGVASIHVVLRDNDPEILRLKVRNTMSLFSRIDGIESKPERRSSPSVFFSCCTPFASGPAFEKMSYRSRLQALPWITNLLPIFGGYSGTASRPVLAAPTLDNPQSIFTFDPFDETQVNWNTMIIGKSGSGKSSLVIRLMSSFKLYNPMIFLFEKGTNGCSSYQRFVELNGGQHFAVSKTKPFCINVFDARNIDANNPSELSEIISFSTSFCEILAGGLNVTEYSILSSQIRSLFDVKDCYYLSDLYQALSESNDNESSNLAKKLLLFTKKGSLGDFVDGETTLSIKTDLVSFDLDGIFDEERLLPAYFFAIDQAILHYIRNNPTRKHLTLYDEVWKPLEYEVIRKSLLSKNRLIRKQYGGGAVYYVDQLVGTFNTWDETRKILAQTTNWFLLEMEKSDTENLHDAGFTQQEVKIAASLKTEPGKSSTVYARRIESGMPRGAIIINEVTPLYYSIMTNDGDDNHIFSLIENEIKCQNTSYEKADVIRAFAQLLPRGIRPILSLVREEQERNPSKDMLSIVRSIQNRRY